MDTKKKPYPSEQEISAVMKARNLKRPGALQYLRRGGKVEQTIRDTTGSAPEPVRSDKAKQPGTVSMGDAQALRPAAGS
jgi:hypothetical protein